MCITGKISYANHDLATTAMYHAQSVAKKGGAAPIRVYYCFDCEKYHLTSQVKDNKDKRNG